MAEKKALHTCDCSCVDDRLGVYGTAVDYYSFLGRKLERDNDNGNWSTGDFEIDCLGGSWLLTYAGSGTISAPNFSGDAPYTMKGPHGGSGNVHIAGTFTSPGNGTFSTTITGALAATTVTPGVISGGVVTSPAVLSISSPSGLTITGQSPTFTAPGSGGAGTFDFSGTISGTADPYSIDVYDKMTINSMDQYGVVVERFRASDDVKQGEWTNPLGPWIKGTCELQMYRSYHSPDVCDNPDECDPCLQPSGPDLPPNPACEATCDNYAIRVDFGTFETTPPSSGAPLDACCAAVSGRSAVLYRNPDSDANCRWTSGDFDPSFGGHWDFEGPNGTLTSATINVAVTHYPSGPGGPCSAGVTASVVGLHTGCNYDAAVAAGTLTGGSSSGLCRPTPWPSAPNGTITIIPIP